MSSAPAAWPAGCCVPTRPWLSCGGHVGRWPLRPPRQPHRHRRRRQMERVVRALSLVAPADRRRGGGDPPVWRASGAAGARDGRWPQARQVAGEPAPGLQARAAHRRAHPQARGCRNGLGSAGLFVGGGVRALHLVPSLCRGHPQRAHHAHDGRRLPPRRVAAHAARAQKSRKAHQGARVEAWGGGDHLGPAGEKKGRFSHMWRPPSLCVFPYVSG